MGRLLDIWRSWSVRRRLAVAGGAAILLAGAAALVVYLAVVKRPADKSCNPCAPLETVPQPKRPAKTDDWPVYGFDYQRTRYLPTRRVLPPYSRPLWTFDAGSLLEFSPILVDGILYDMDKLAVMYAIRHKTGKVIWKRQIGSLNASAPAYKHGVLFATTLEPGEVVALRARDGKVLWRHPLPGRTETSPLVVDGRVLVGCECGDVLALDPDDGSIKWSVHTAGAVKGGVAVDRGVAFIGNYAGEMYAIRVSDGSVKWEASSQGLSFNRTGRFYSTPAVAYGRVFAGNIDGRVYSFDEDTGQLAWSKSTGDYVYAGPAAADTPHTPPTVYIGSADHILYALDAQTGTARWQRSIGGPILGAASVIGETVYVSSTGDSIGTFGFDVRDGKQVFASGLGEYNPAISDSRWLYLTGSSKLVALKPVKRRPHRQKRG